MLGKELKKIIYNTKAKIKQKLKKVKAIVHEISYHSTDQRILFQVPEKILQECQIGHLWDLGDGLSNLQNCNEEGYL